MNNDLIVVGAGGHSRVVLAILSYYNNYNVIGVADSTSRSIGEKIDYTKISYTWEDLSSLYDNGVKHAVIAIGDNKKRSTLFCQLKKIGFKFPNIIHPNAFVEKNAIFGSGNLITMGANIGSSVEIGNNCIIYGSTIEHETKIENNVFIAPSVSIAGRVKLGDSCFIGIGSSVVEKITIGKRATIGAGSVVIDNVGNDLTVAGIPAKSLGVNTNENGYK